MKVAYLAMMSGKAFRMLVGRSERFLGRPANPGGRLMASPCSSTLFALPRVLLSPVSASPKPTLAIFLIFSYKDSTLCVYRSGASIQAGIVSMQLSNSSMLLELLTDAMSQERCDLDALRQIAEHGGLNAVWYGAILQHWNVSHQHSVTLCAFLGVHEVLQKSRAASCMLTAATYTRHGRKIQEQKAERGVHMASG